MKVTVTVTVCVEPDTLDYLMGHMVSASDDPADVLSAVEDMLDEGTASLSSVRAFIKDHYSR